MDEKMMSTSPRRKVYESNETIQALVNTLIRTGSPIREDPKSKTRIPCYFPLYIPSVRRISDKGQVQRGRDSVEIIKVEDQRPQRNQGRTKILT